MTEKRLIVPLFRDHLLGSLCLALALVLVPFQLATAQHGRAPKKDASDATTHTRISDGDRVFMRTAAGLFVHDRQLAQLAGTRSQSREVKQFVSRWRIDLERLQAGLQDLANRNRIELPQDMSDESRARLEAVASQNPTEFDRGFRQYATASLSHESKLFQNSVRKMESETLRRWAQGALGSIERQALEAQKLSSKSR